MTGHKLYKVIAFEIIGPYTLKIFFDDNTNQIINFEPILRGRLYSPLQDLAIFNQVRLDFEVHTLVWLNGADFDPETLRNWPEYKEAFIEMAQRWEPEPA